MMGGAVKHLIEQFQNTESVSASAPASASASAPASAPAEAKAEDVQLQARQAFYAHLDETLGDQSPRFGPRYTRNIENRNVWSEAGLKAINNARKSGLKNNNLRKIADIVALQRRLSVLSNKKKTKPNSSNNRSNKRSSFLSAAFDKKYSTTPNSTGFGEDIRSSFFPQNKQHIPQYTNTKLRNISNSIARSLNMTAVTKQQQQIIKQGTAAQVEKLKQDYELAQKHHAGISAKEISKAKKYGSPEHQSSIIKMATDIQHQLKQNYETRVAGLKASANMGMRNAKRLKFSKSAKGKKKSKH